MPFPLADMGSPLMLAGACHLVAGNFIIGIGEGLLLAKLFKISAARAVLCMVPANYFSMIAGSIFFSSTTAHVLAEQLLGNVPLYRISTLLTVAIVLSYVSTIFLEWPFIIAAMWKSRHGPARTLLASFVVQTASYLVLILLYGSVTSLSLAREAKPVSAAGLSTNPLATVFYIDAKNHGAYQLHLDGSPPQLIQKLDGDVENDSLSLILSADEKSLDLCVTMQMQPTQTLLYAVGTVPPVQDEPYNTLRYFGSGPATDLQPSESRTWYVRTGTWAMDGLHADNAMSGERVHLALETPFVTWWSGYATVLPHDQVVYQLADQIVLLDLPTKRIAFLARGTSPVVALKPGATATTTTPENPPAKWMSPQ